MIADPRYVQSDEPGQGVGLALVIALNGVLIIRPEELFPLFDGLHLYYVLIVCALLYYAPAIIQEFSGSHLAHRPLLVLVFGLLIAVVLSQLANFQVGKALQEGQEFVKVVAYYLLVTIAVNSLAALRVFLIALVVSIVIQTALALLQYHQFIDIAALRPFQQWEFDPDGEVSILNRLCGSGIYHDPNDLCLLLIAGMLICLDLALRHGGAVRLLWAALLGTFVYALTLTHSRGGLLAVMTGLTAYFAGKYGAKRTILLLLVLAPVGLAVFAGRQTRFDLDDENDTSQLRVRIWSDGFELIPSQPLFGIGAGRYAEQCGLVAHNSFVHAYVELGLVGGGLFLAAFALAVCAVWTTNPSSSLPPAESDELTRLRPVVLGLLLSYVAGMFSLSRNYIPPTYLPLALATVYVRLAAPGGLDWFQLDRRMLIRLGAITVLGYCALKLFIAAFVRF
jgi:putative inorganic carbon (hco3(-)) transporter